jgi:hypothetical protein
MISHEGQSVRSPFVTLLSRHAQYGRWSSFGKRVCFTESHTVLIISFLLVLFTQFILDIKQWSAISSKTTTSFLGNWHSHFSVLPLTPHSVRELNSHWTAIARSEPDGTRWRTVEELKGKDVNGLGSQQPCTVRWNTVYPELLPAIKTWDNLASSMVSRELWSKIRQFQNHCFHITLNCCWHSEFGCFPCYVIWYDILVSCNCVDTRWQ